MAYKIYLNLSVIDIGKLCDKLGEFGDVVFHNNCFYLWANEKVDKNSILFTLSQLGIKEYYCEEINFEEVSRETGFVFAWLSEHFRDCALEKFEDEHQEELRQMEENIKNAYTLLEERIRQVKEEQSDVGRKNGKAQKRKTSQDKG